MGRHINYINCHLQLVVVVYSHYMTLFVSLWVCYTVTSDQQRDSDIGFLISNFIYRKTVQVHNKYKTIQWQYEKKKQQHDICNA